MTSQTPVLLLISIDMLYRKKKYFEIQRQSGEADNLENFICLHLRHDFTSSQLPENSLTALFFAIQ